jgi:uncharacterized protein YbaR (Trm112 family)
MHLTVTDLLVCPHCGPGFGLVLLADRIEERRVLEGWLGCSNCRERYRVTGGFAELQPGKLAGAPRPGAGATSDPGRALRLAAMAGITEGPAFLLVLGSGAVLAPLIAGLVPGLEVITTRRDLEGWPETAGVSRLGADGLPFHTQSLRAVALTAGAENELESAARLVAPLGRLVLEEAPADGAARLARAGVKLVMQDGSTMVAVRK